jgi:hypothetical protein
MRYVKSILLLTSILLWPLSTFSVTRAEPPLQDTARYISPFDKENEYCFKCHSVKKYEFTDEAGKIMKGVMQQEKILVRDSFYSSNHKSFSCTDCHSSQFREFPHPEKLKNEPQFNCMDCHGGDPSFAVFNFEGIDAEYRKSVHYDLEDKGFSCWQCHDPHSYRLTARYSEDLKETVKYDNASCLNCHADYKKFNKYSNSDKIKLSKVHKWLPNQSTHFKNVRCIDCHAKASKEILVPHNILPEEEALRNCSKCHSMDTEAMSSLLLKRLDNNNRSENDNVFLKGLSIIGPNRNNHLDKLIMTVFGVLILVIGIHVLFRIIWK